MLIQWDNLMLIQPRDESYQFKLHDKGFISIWELKGKVLVIAEKPKASKRIALALAQNPTVYRYKGIPYYEIRNATSTVIVASAAGHLYELHTDASGYPVFEYKWIPAYLVNDEKSHTKAYLELLEMLSKRCNYYVNACDYDIEGSVIGYLIIKHLGDERRAFRAKFSSLVPSELRASFSRLMPLDYDMIEAGLCRHELDWLWGINISRALMRAVFKSTGRRTTLSVGRVQTPTLKYVVDKTLERKLHIPLPQFSVHVLLEKDGARFVADLSTNPIARKADAEAVARLLSSHGYLVVKDLHIERYRYSPPPPFNLSDLQEEAARIYGLSPMETQNIAEQLYLEALISYPRTNSQKLPPGLNYKEILLKLAQIKDYSSLVSRLIAETKGILKPVEGEKEDPAHPAIYPTGLLPQKPLSKKQHAIYDLIVRRFLAVFAPPAIITRTKVILVTPRHEYSFEATGLVIESPGWLTYYPFHKPEARMLPYLRQGDVVKVVKVKVNRSYTKPPPRLRKIDILRWMESVGIGTESTRALIIEKLFERGYLASTRTGIDVTDLGFGIVDVIEKFFPELGSVELTRRFEALIEDIMKRRRLREEIVQGAKEVIRKLIEKFDMYSIEVGKMLSRSMGLEPVTSKCNIPSCRREPYANGLCKYHYQALELVKNMYSEWKNRENASFAEYLAKLAKLKLTGDYVRDVVKYVLKAGD